MGRQRRASGHGGPPVVPCPRRHQRAAHGRAGARARTGAHRGTPGPVGGLGCADDRELAARIRCGELDDRAEEVRAGGGDQRPRQAPRRQPRGGSTTTRRRLQSRLRSAMAWKPPSTWTISPVVFGNQSDSRATHALATASASARTSQPSGARSSHTSSNCEKPGIDLAAIVLIGSGGDEVHPDALGPEVAGEVAGGRLEGGLGHAHPVVGRPGLTVSSKSRPTIEPPSVMSGTTTSARVFSE